jgi:hypothetical protein
VWIVTLCSLASGDATSRSRPAFSEDEKVFCSYAAVLGQEPDLKEVDRALARCVVLAVGDAGAGGHPLHIAGADHRAGAHRVLVFERTVEHVRDDLHVAMRVPAEALAGSDAIFIDDPQRAEAHVGGVVVVGEREGVVAVEPAVVGVAALAGSANGDHGSVLWVDQSGHDQPSAELAIG